MSCKKTLTVQEIQEARNASNYHLAVAVAGLMVPLRAKTYTPRLVIRMVKNLAATWEAEQMKLTSLSAISGGASDPR